MALKSLSALVALFAIVTISQMIASEHGEVVVITTTDASHVPHETHVWIVDHDGHSWIRSGSPTSGWYERLRRTPTFELERNGSHERYTAKAIPENRANVNALMRVKYGWADAYIGTFFSRANAIPIRIDPLAPHQ